MKARVKAGRLVLDEPSELPEGTEIALAPADEGDDLDDAERAELHAVLDQGLADVHAGVRGEPADDLLARLRRP